MHRDTFVNVVAGIKKLGVKRVRVVGNGEATLHPDFDSFMTEIGSTNAYVSVLTNGQWRHQEDTINTMLTAKVNMVEFSVDTVTKKGYERSRQGGSFERLLSNLQHFKEAKKKQRSQVITNIRLMLRPSERRIEWKLKAFWSNYADIVMPQYLCEKRSISYNEDLYRPIQFNEQSYPNCKEPFTQLGITWNGDVPLCSLSADQIGEPGLILGNVTSSTIGQLWNSKVLHQYRRGHRNRETSKMAMCKGCVGM
ncbi:MAG: hypothetical protein SCALA701_08110 [Candidatus Scalindua sp.]|nr:MAG: hypothetical protein SCALA701_08110 [Candidatus Scalindua sp.]